MNFQVPTFCRIEYWSPVAGDWWVGHAGMNLMDPEKYVTKVTERGKIARAVVVDTDEIIWPTGFGADLL